MIHHPPSITVPSRGHAAGWHLAAIVLAVLLGVAGCKGPDESVAGLVVVAAGSVKVTDDGGELVVLEGAPIDARRATAARGRIVVQAGDGTFAVSDLPAAGAKRAWRPLEIDNRTGRLPSGMDLAADGRILAIARGDPDTPGMDVITVDVDSGAATVLPLDLMANGPPAWVGPHLLALEVIRPDQLAGVATLDTDTGDVRVTPATGIEASATSDGSLVAVAEDPSGIVIRSTADWLAGVNDATVGLSGPEGATLLDIALDADATRLAAVYGAPAGGSSTVVILRRRLSGWENVNTVEGTGDGPVAIDWLD